MVRQDIENKNYGFSARQVSLLVLGVCLVIPPLFVEAIAEVSGLSGRPQNLTCIVPARPSSVSSIALEEVAAPPGNQSAGSLLAMRQLPGDSSRWLLARRAGKIEMWQDGGTFSFVGTVLDISERVALTFQGGSFPGIGLVGIALHPDFQQNGEMFVYYGFTPNADRNAPPLFMRLSRFHSLDGGLTFDPSTEEVLISTEQSTSQHKGGNLEFGPDGFLYIGVGDDLNGPNGQDLGTLKAKMLRIDVDSGSPYGIPTDNPLVGGNGLPEIYAWGIRQPWRWSFDRDTGELWEGNVGVIFWEEVNKIVKGGNYGWPIWEGLECLIPNDCDRADLIHPITQFANVGPTAVIGGYVYRGSVMPELQGVYIYADGRKSTIYGLFYDNQGNPDPQILMEVDQFINSFAEGADGELYVLSEAPRKIWRIVRAGSPPVDSFPQLLSQTGCVDSFDPTQPAPGLIPYDVNSPLWSDGAAKKRWMALPDWAVVDSTIQIESDGDFTFPIGTVLVKEFQLGGKRIETRLFMRHDDGEWGGYSYEWDDQETDATLLPAGKTKLIGNQQWTYPGRNQCQQCHTFAAGRTLGPEVAQLNGDMTYPSTGITANQLDTLGHIGVLEGGLPAPAQDLARLPQPDDLNEPLGLRARSYLHANCSMCHRPGGPGHGPADFRHYVSNKNVGVINTAPTQDLGVPGALLLTPGDPGKSIMSLRMHALGLERMPPLGTAIVDVAGATLIDDWITADPSPVDSYTHIGTPGYQLGVDQGFYIWQDASDGEWHIRWSGDSNGPALFSGTITATGDFSSAQGYSIEGNDSLTIGATSISFNAYAGAGEDGIDFFLPDGAEVVFDLFIDQKTALGSIRLGESGATAGTGIVTLVSKAASTPIGDALENLTTIGRPDYVLAQDAGYFLWQDSDDGEWHLRWSGDSTGPILYEGTITTSTAPITNVQLYSFEGNDALITSTSTVLQFSGLAGAGDDGIDFFVPEGAQVSFNLLTDGQLTTSGVFIGQSQATPLKQPFVLLSAITSISTSGQPAYVPAQDAGYYLWRDSDDGEWHLRWSGDSTGPILYEGTILSSNGISSMSAFGFESNDQLAAVSSGLNFSGVAGAGDDGVDFFVPDSSQLIFEINVDGNKKPGLIYIGTDGLLPVTVPFSLFSS